MANAAQCLDSPGFKMLVGDFDDEWRRPDGHSDPQKRRRGVVFDVVGIKAGQQDRHRRRRTTSAGCKASLHQVATKL
jgi:hypothetical protein